MKKSVLSLLLSLILSMLFCLQVSASEVKIKVDPRIELLSVIELLSDDYTNLTEYNGTYKGEMEEYFAEYKNHSAVKTFSKLWRTEFGKDFNLPSKLMLCLSNPPELKMDKELIESEFNKIDVEDIKPFIKQLREFSEDSNFMNFFNQHQDIYQTYIHDIRQKMKDRDYIAALENYHGIKYNNYTLILAPIFHSGGFGPKVKNRVYNIMGPGGVENGHVSFRTENYLEYLCWHEFGHSFSNPVVNKYKKEVSNYNQLFIPIAEQMYKQGYVSWFGAVIEHIVRAVHCRLIALEKGEKQGKWAVLKEDRKGFKYISLLYQKLKKYEKNRDKYKTFAEFYPELIKVFKQEAKETSVPINFWRLKLNTPRVIVLPTNEKQDGIEKVLKKYVNKFKNTFIFSTDTSIITDKQALKRDLSRKLVVTFGTMEGNLWLAKYKNKFPAKITKDKATIDNQTYHGKDLQLVVVWSNPQNSDRAVVTFTSQRGEIFKLRGIPLEFSRNYFVIKGDQLLKKGSY